jgi:hypothetical protein
MRTGLELSFNLGVHPPFGGPPIEGVRPVRSTALANPTIENDGDAWVRSEALTEICV